MRQDIARVERHLDQGLLRIAFILHTILKRDADALGPVWTVTSSSMPSLSSATMRARVYEALGRKYCGTSDAAKFVEIFGRVDDPESVYLRLVPEDGLTWDYGSN